MEFLRWLSRLTQHYSHSMNTNPHGLPGNFLDLLLDVVCVVDRKGYFLFVSAASEQVFGYTPEELIGRGHYWGQTLSRRSEHDGAGNRTQMTQTRPSLYGRIAAR